MKKILCLLVTILFVICTAPTFAEEWVCPICNNHASGNFCNSCGAAKPITDWICPKCGNLASGNFCNNCGAAKPEADEEETESSSALSPTLEPTAQPLPMTEVYNPITSENVTNMIADAIAHAPIPEDNSPDKYTYYVRDYVGKDASSVGYTSLGGDRMDHYGNAYVELCFITADGTYIDIEDKDLLSQYIVIGQNYAPNTELKLTYQKDDDGKEYDNLIATQSIDLIDLQVARFDGELYNEPIQYDPIVITPSPDKYTYYIRNYVGKNAAFVGYTSLGGDRMDHYGEAYVELCFVTADGTYVDIEDEDLLQQYIVIGQNYVPNTALKLTYQKDSDGKEYDNLIATQNIDLIDIQVVRLDGELYNEPVQYDPIAVTLPSDKYTYYIRNYVGKNAASVGYTSLSGKRMDQYGEAYVELALVTDDGTYIDVEDEDLLQQYIVVSQNHMPNTELRLTFLKDSKGKEYDNLIDEQSIEKIILTLEEVNSIPDGSENYITETNVHPVTTAAPVVTEYSGTVHSSRDFSYILQNDDTAVIIGYTGTSSSISIPSDLDGYEVSGIGPSVFENHSEITSISIWADITFIDERAFMGCSSLKDISIPSECEKIGASAFEGCIKLSSVILWGDPNIGARAFFGCTSLKKISIGSDTEEIGESAFEGCTKLKHVNLWGDPNISARAFFGCTNLKEISFGSDTEVIGESAFEGCTNLKRVTIWGGTNIEPRAFYGCTSIEELSFDSDTEYIGDYAFYGCTSLEKVTIWGSDTEIGTEAFGNCPELEKINQW